MFSLRILGLVFLLIGVVLFGAAVSILGFWDALGSICSGAITAGTIGGGDIMIAYDPDPMKLEMNLPFELQFLAPQEKG